MRIKLGAVLFDMDGLILDSERIAKQIWEETIKGLGFEVGPTVYKKMIGRNRKDSTLLLKEIFGPEFPVKSCFEQAEKRYIAEIKEKGVPIKKGLLSLLSYLKKEAIPIAVATSTNREKAILKLTRTNLISEFSTIVAGDEVSLGKPAPDIFLKAAEKIKVEPSRCFVLEDSFAGIRAAFAAKMSPIMVPDLVEPDESIRSLCIVKASLVEVQEFFRSQLEN